MVNLTGGGFSGGYKKYLLSLVPVMRRMSRLESLAVYVPESSLGGLNLPDLKSWRGGVISGRRNLRKELSLSRPDVIFVPNFPVVRFENVPCVNMIRNMEMVTSPLGQNNAIDSVKNLARQFLAKQSCKSARRVIAVSGYVQNYLVNFWRVPADKVGIVYHGVDPALPIESMRCPAALLRENPPTQFLFTAGSILPYRGLEDLLTAAMDPRWRLPILIAGDPPPGSETYARHLHHFCDKYSLNEKVIWAGQLKLPELAWCYHHCAVFAMTSRVEACPNTALEALSYSCNTVSTDNSPMPEFFRDTALYYRAGDIESLIIQVASAMEGADSNGRREAARRRAEEFSWQHTAESTMNELENALRSEPRGDRRACP